jgi:PAS domain S-box-containing protein
MMAAVFGDEVAKLTGSDPRDLPALKTVTAVAAAIVMLGSLSVLLGWALDEELLRGLTPGRETTKPLGALGLLFAGAALLLLRGEEAVASRRRLLGLACAGVPLLVGSLTLLEQGLDVDLGIDRLLFAEALADDGPFAGRPVFPISLCLALLGLALVTLHTRLAKAGDGMVVLVLIPGLLVLIGYLYDAVPFYRVEPLRPVPVVAAVLVVVLALGYLAARPDSALVDLATSRLAGGVAARRLLPAAILLPLFLGLLRLVGQRLGLYGTELGLALFATLNVAVFVALVYSSARRLNEADAEREAAHAAVLESEESFRRLLDATPAGLVMVDADGRIATANATAEQLFGYEAGRLAGQPVEVLVPERFRPPHPALRRAFEAGERPRLLGGGRDLVGLRRDGSEFPAGIAVSPVDMPQGRFALASIVDVTERKRSADEIRSLNATLERRVVERTRQLSRAQEIAHLGSWELDLVNDSLGWSDEVYRIFGLAPQEFKATYAAFLEAVHPDDRAAVDAAYSGSIRDKHDTYEIEHRVIKRATGEVRYVHEKCEHFRDESGRVVRSTGMVHDITERKLAEQSLRRTADELDRRTRELAASLEHKEALLKEIHHRVKNNMQVVSSLLRLQSDALPDPAVREALAESQRRVRAMALLHEQLYRSSDLARVDFGSYVLDLASYLRRSLTPSSPHVEIRVDVENVLLEMDRAMPLGLLVSELVSNSLKHAFPSESGEGPRQVWVVARREPPCGLTLTVGDNGVGLPELVDLEGPPSMGMGLVKAFVDQLQGRLAVARRPGTVVTVTLPEKAD